MLDDCNILLVEDEAIVALDLSLALEDEGAAVTGPFATVESALPSCAGAIDAAILDVDIQGSRSFRIADALLEKGVPFVFHTGSSDLTSLTDRYGDDVPVVRKPSQHAEIIGVLKRLVTK